MASVLSTRARPFLLSPLAHETAEVRLSAPLKPVRTPGAAVEGVIRHEAFGPSGHEGVSDTVDVGRELPCGSRNKEERGTAQAKKEEEFLKECLTLRPMQCRTEKNSPREIGKANRRVLEPPFKRLSYRRRRPPRP